MSDDGLKAREAVNDAFRARRHETATEQELRDWLAVLCTETAGNDRLHPRDVIRGLTINHTQMARTIAKLEATILKLDAANSKTQRLVVTLAGVAIFVGVLQCLIGLASMCK
jgi:hypothetical protein